MFHLRKANKEDESKIMDLVESVLSDYGLKTNPYETDKDLLNLENYYFSKSGWFNIISPKKKKLSMLSPLRKVRVNKFNKIKRIHINFSRVINN